MSAYPITNYAALYESLRTRRLKPIAPKNLDTVAVRARVTLDRARLRSKDLFVRAHTIADRNKQTKSMSDAVLNQAVDDIREVFVRRRQQREHVDQALALIREVARRETGEEPFPVQLMGALAMYHGRVIEMLTGEGKTLTASIAAPLIAWHHRKVHVLTVNDYLAQRDAQSRECIYKRCGVRVGAIVQETQTDDRFQIYAREIVYGTPKQIVADWLRDQIRLGQAKTPWVARTMQQSLEAAGGVRFGEGRGILPMVPGLHACIVDEADAVLIDEGVVPLIIARARREDDMASVYAEACELSKKLDEGNDYEMDLVLRKATLKFRGQQRLRQLFAEHLARGGQPLFKATQRAEELIRQALVAKHCYIRGQQYEIVDGKVMIVDEYTGRFLADRNWEHGLHQSVEAKEGVEVTADRETLARLSFQRYFRSYPFLCGMTGTAADATGEIESTYSRPVMVIPTNRPCVRQELPTRVFRTARDKWAAIADDIATRNAKGQPVIVGSRSITSSEHVARMLTQRGIPHQVLNANFDKDEANLIAQAGHGGTSTRSASVTVATNMAGRGTDIKIDEAARAAGGLHVMLTEMHGAKRIDRQFIGRAGRQGDPGSCQMFVSLEDELIRKFAKWAGRIARERSSGPEVSGAPGVLALFRWAQSRNEAHDRRNRSSVLRQDDWIDKHLPGMG